MTAVPSALPPAAQAALDRESTPLPGSSGPRVQMLPGGLSLTGPIGNLPVRIDNNGDTDIVWKYNSESLVLPAGRSVMVPWMHMVRYMGDPRAIDIDDKRRHRHRERMRLASLYGIYEHGELWRVGEAPCGCYEHESTGRLITKDCTGHLPNVVARNLESGEQYMTVIDDPEGTSLAGVDPGASRMQQLEKMVESLSSQLLNLSSQLTSEQNANRAIEDTVTLAPEAPKAKGKIPVDRS